MIYEIKDATTGLPFKHFEFLNSLYKGICTLIQAKIPGIPITWEFKLEGTNDDKMVLTKRLSPDGYVKDFIHWVRDDGKKEVQIMDGFNETEDGVKKSLMFIFTHVVLSDLHRLLSKLYYDKPDSISSFNFLPVITILKASDYYRIDLSQSVIQNGKWVFYRIKRDENGIITKTEYSIPLNKEHVVDWKSLTQDVLDFL